MIWVPDDATEPKLFILVGSHAGYLRHWGEVAIERIMREACYWGNVTEQALKHEREYLL